MSDLQRCTVSPAPLADDDLIAAYPTDRSRPWLRVNFVTSLDGAVADTAGYSAGLSGTADKKVFGLLRMQCDALLVGAGTLRHEGYGALTLDAGRRRWRLANGLAEHPTQLIVSRSLDLDPAAEVFTKAPVRPMVLTADASPPQRRRALAEVADVLVTGDTDVDLAAALDILHRTGRGQILCEGGPQVLGALTAADLVDELCLTVTPMLIGPGPGRIIAGPATPDPRRLALRHVLTGDGMLLLRYTRSSSV